MLNNISIIIISTLSLLLLGCTSSKSTFFHPQHGELSPSSPLLDKELRSCSKEIKIELINPVPTVADVAVSAIPVILKEDVLKGIEQGTKVFQSIKAVKTINNIKNTTQQSRSSLLSCMKRKGWTTVKK